MRQKQAQAKPKRRRVAEEPLAEGIRTKRPRFFFTKMDDDELIGYAQRQIEGGNIRGRRELSGAHPGLYDVLRRRDLLGKVGIEGRYRNLSRMSDEELVRFSRGVIERGDIRSRNDLRTKDNSLYVFLLRRRLLDEVGLVSKQRHNRVWSSMSDEEIIDLAKRLIRDRGITSRKGLKEADMMLYNKLRKRGILEDIGLESSIGKHRDWASMDDDQLVGYAKRIVGMRGIKNRKELQKTDCGLYRVLWKRGLLGRLEFQERATRWSSMSDREIIALAKRRIEEEGIGSRYGLQRYGKGLYPVLWKRGLLGEVFTVVDTTKECDGIREVVKALGEF